MRTVILNLFWSITLLFSYSNCNETPPKPALLPPQATAPTAVNISNLNYWVEADRFFVVGICDNLSNDWQKILLRMAPMKNGKPITVNDAVDAVFPTFSDAVPPRGRTSFMAEWPLGAFSDTPDSCTVTGGGAIPMSPGPILIATEQSGVKMLVGEKVGDSLVMVEKAWQVNVLVENPLDVQALHPRVELLVYGTDQRLWFAGVLNPEDPQQKQVVNAEHEGTMAPQEKRRIGANVYYNSLPQALKDKKIGRIEFHPFEARQ
jgi:hypothetical protein